MNDSQKILQKYMKKVSQEQLVNYIAVDIAESLKSYPSQTDISRVEKLLKTHFVAANARHTKHQDTLPCRAACKGYAMSWK